MQPVTTPRAILTAELVWTAFQALIQESMMSTTWAFLKEWVHQQVGSMILLVLQMMTHGMGLRISVAVLVFAPQDAELTPNGWPFQLLVFSLVHGFASLW